MQDASGPEGGAGSLLGDLNASRPLSADAAKAHFASVSRLASGWAADPDAQAARAARAAEMAAKAAAARKLLAAKGMHGGATTAALGAPP